MSPLLQVGGCEKCPAPVRLVVRVKGVGHCAACYVKAGKPTADNLKKEA